MWKSAIARGKRRLGVLTGVDSLVVRCETVRGHRARRRFGRVNTAVAVPPAMLAFNGYGHRDPGTYRRQGIADAADIAGLVV